MSRIFRQTISTTTIKRLINSIYTSIEFGDVIETSINLEKEKNKI